MHFDSPSMGRGIMVNIFLTCLVNELVTMKYFILLFLGTVRASSGTNGAKSGAYFFYRAKLVVSLC